MDEATKRFVIALLLVAIAAFSVLPSWRPVKPGLNITSAKLVNGTVSFEVSYAAPWPKSCFLVVYGPFRYDRPGHEEGNNIYVIEDKRTGTIKDSLKLQPNATLDRLKIELWCDWDKLAEAEKRL